MKSQNKDISTQSKNEVKEILDEYVVSPLSKDILRIKSQMEESVIKVDENMDSIKRQLNQVSDNLRWLKKKLDISFHFDDEEDAFEKLLDELDFDRKLENTTEPIANEIKNKYNYVTIENLFNIMADFRMVKEAWEVENIVKAIDITKDGIYNMMRNSKAGMMEYQIESYFDFALKQRGVKDFAFKTIAASGKNATVLHYSDNNSKTEDGDLILFDVGAQYEYYNGDISRTFPVNGKFTDRQKTIYNIVLEGQQIVIDKAKAGIEFKSLNCILKDYYAKALSKIGLISNAEEVNKYYYHGVSHLLGLETHDVGRHNEGLLKSGMVMTVEPGLYIAEEGIGIRIEDNILIEDNGCRVLSKDIIKTVEDIEDFMK